MFRDSVHLHLHLASSPSSLPSLITPSNMSFVRTFAATSRALRQQSSINPLQSALRGQAFVNSARTYATAFERNKPHVNIGTIGHVDHGKVCIVHLSVLNSRTKH
jgi:GTPase